MTRRRRWKRILAWLVVLVLAGWLAGALSRWWAHRGPVQQVRASAQQLERGRYLADAADCAACHTAAGGAAFAGGVALASPFGTIHGTNITPDPEHGIGRYTADDFFRVLRHGKARDGHLLYPAMPYVSYKNIAREDSDAIYAYLMNQPAMSQPNLKNDLHFPANIRTGLHLWNGLFARTDIPPASRGASPAWQRGRYLVDTLGHCGECHTPRKLLGQLDPDRPLRGNDELGRYAAPDISPEGLSSRGWDTTQLQRYLSTGVSAHAVASDEMLKVVTLSTSRLHADDLNAMSVYLLGDSPPAPASLAVSTILMEGQGKTTYLNLCSGCHGSDGKGVPHVAPGMHGYSSVRSTDPHNLIVAILDGLPAHNFPGVARMQDMPGFATELDDAQIAELVTWLRNSYGGQAGTIEASTVSTLRARAPVRE